MPRHSGLLDIWADFKEARLAAGLPVVGSFPGENRLAPLAEAAYQSGGDLQSAELTEAAVPSDFPNALGNTLYKRIVQWAGQIAPEEMWRKYMVEVENIDFRPNNQILVSEMEDLLPVPTGMEYQDSTMGDAVYPITVAVWGRTFSINRETIINDNIGVLSDLPQKMARAVSRTKNKQFVRVGMEGNINSYDGTPVFSAGHRNLATGAASALSSTSLQTAIYSVQTQTGDPNLFPDGGPMQMEPKYLVVPPGLQFVARQLIQSTLVVAAGGATPDVTFGNINPLNNLLEVVVERWLTSPTAWYVFTDPNEAPGFAVAHLRGKINPDLLLERPNIVDVMGGAPDGHELEVDRFSYKVRDQFGVAGAAYWGCYRGQGV